MIHYSNCPACKSDKILPVIKAEDFTVSHEVFEIWQCSTCTLRFTQDVPDQSGIGKYYQSAAYISHTETKQGLVNRLYHSVRSYTLAQKIKLIKKISGKDTGNILDIGAGTGAFLGAIKTAGWSVTGLEPDETARRNAVEKHHVELQELNELFNLQPSSFDVITLWHVLEHVHQMQEYVQRFNELLKNDGVLIVAVPNYTSNDAEVYKSHWAAYDVPRHLYHFSLSSMETLMKQHGFKIKKILPMWFDSFYVSMLSEKYKNGRVNYLRAFINGCKSNLAAINNTGKCSSIIYCCMKAI
ncbi:MAG: class SAM-dependent methyltransferase [Chitinophagaceae bacterium]|nr:class SAM-dependent methyltransferase [Chitinophagaceae bacterium]